MESGNTSMGAATGHASDRISNIKMEEVHSPLVGELGHLGRISGQAPQQHPGPIGFADGLT
jgi:hypothetical protein